MTTYTKAITSNTDIDNEPEFIMTDGISEIRRSRVRAQRIRKQQKTACAVLNTVVFIAFLGIFILCLNILNWIHPETIEGFLFWSFIIAMFITLVGGVVAGYLHECILRNWRK